MAGEKYIVATAENSVHISVRNILSPCGYIFQGNCSDGVSLLRLIRSLEPDFVIVDLNLSRRDLRSTIETIDDELSCSCILIGDYRDMELTSFLEEGKVISFCPKPLNKETFINSIELSLLYCKRLYKMNSKLKEMTENYETRKLVERAKWILIEREKISENEAYDRMRRKSMDNRTTMKAIAEAIIFTHEIGKKN